MMKYNPEYVHFEHADGLIDKWCIAADSVSTIKEILEKDDDYIKGQLMQIKIVDNDKDKGFPFSTTEMCPYKFVYVDPEFQDMKRDEEVLKWTDLKIGDIIRSKINRNVFMQVQGIDKSDNVSEHIFANLGWKSDYDLANWEKVEE